MNTVTLIWFIVAAGALFLAALAFNDLTGRWPWQDDDRNDNDRNDRE